MIIQLDPTIPMHTVEHGKGYAIALIDYGPEHDVLWAFVPNTTGEIWWLPNGQMRMQANISMQRVFQPAKSRA